MKILKLTLKKQWFDMILQGIKTEEYREVKEFYVLRLLDFTTNSSKDSMPNYLRGAYNYCVGYTGNRVKATEYLLNTVSKFKHFDFVEFTNGYNRPLE